MKDRRHSIDVCLTAATAAVAPSSSSWLANIDLSSQMPGWVHQTEFWLEANCQLPGITWTSVRVSVCVCVHSGVNSFARATLQQPQLLAQLHTLTALDCARAGQRSTAAAVISMVEALDVHCHHHHHCLVYFRLLSFVCYCSWCCWSWSEKVGQKVVRESAVRPGLLLQYPSPSGTFWSPCVAAAAVDLFLCLPPPPPSHRLLVRWPTRVSKLLCTGRLGWRTDWLTDWLVMLMLTCRIVRTENVFWHWIEQQQQLWFAFHHCRSRLLLWQ